MPLPIRLLCISDTHDLLPPQLDEAGAAAWLHAGDVYEDPSSFEAVEGWDDPDHPDVAAWAQSRAIPVYAVKGNHDIADPFGFFTARRNVTGRVVRLGDDLLLAGVGWAGEDVAPPLDSDLVEVCERVQRQVDAAARWTGDRLVVLSHYPMTTKGLFTGDTDTAWTYSSATELVDAAVPILVVQGHLHDWSGITGHVRVGGKPVLVVNTGPSGMAVEIRGSTAKVVPASKGPPSAHRGV